MAIISRSIAYFLADLVQRGVQLEVAGDRLRFRHRSGQTSDLMEALKLYKPRLIPLLRSTHRWRVAQQIRTARRLGDRGYAITLRDAWRERVAICVISGNLLLHQAYQIAMAELKSVVFPQNMTQ